MAARNTATFPANPAVRGIPPMASSIRVMAAASHGDAPTQAGPVRQGRPAGAVARHHRGHGEGAQHLHGVGGQVEPHVADAAPPGDQGGEDEPGVGHRGVGQQALHVVLDDGQQRPHHHRHRGEHRHRRHPVVGPGPQGGGQHPGQGGEPGHLGGGGEEPGDPSRRPLVDVGGPDVEGRRRDLEGHPHQQQGQAGEQHPRAEDDGAAQVVGDAADPVDGGRPGGGEDQGHPVEEHRRGEGPEQEVLQRGLVGVRPAPG